MNSYFFCKLEVCTNFKCNFDVRFSRTAAQFKKDPWEVSVLCTDDPGIGHTCLTPAPCDELQGLAKHVYTPVNKRE